MSTIINDIFFALVLLSYALSVDAGTVELQKYCSTLNQSKADTTQCFEKPRQYTIDGDPFIAAYMCCFGYFNDVTNIYFQFVSFSFVQWFVKLTNADTLQYVAEFLLMCARGSNVLNEVDYNYWVANKKVPCGCKALNG